MSDDRAVVGTDHQGKSKIIGTSVCFVIKEHNIFRSKPGILAWVSTLYGSPTMAILWPAFFVFVLFFLVNSALCMYVYYIPYKHILKSKNIKLYWALLFYPSFQSLTNWIPPIATSKLRKNWPGILRLESVCGGIGSGRESSQSLSWNLLKVISS